MTRGKAQPKRPQGDDGRMRPEGAAEGSERTPIHIADQYQGRDEYYVENILAKHLRKGKAWYHVEWTGLPGGDTWEPVANLASEDGSKAVTAFEATQDAMNAEVRSCFYNFA